MHHPPADNGVVMADVRAGDEGDPDKRVSQQQADSAVEHPAEFAGGKPGE